MPATALRQAQARRVEHDLQELLQRTIAVDGTFLQAVAEVAWAVANSNHHGARRHRARLDAHLDVSTWLPEVIVVPEPGQSEADSALESLQAGRIYLSDRGYWSFALLRAHYAASVETTAGAFAAQAHFVVRHQPAGGNSPELDEAVERPLTAADRAAGVLSDRVGHFASDHARQAGIAKIQLREVLIS